MILEYSLATINTEPDTNRVKLHVALYPRYEARVKYMWCSSVIHTIIPNMVVGSV